MPAKAPDIVEHRHSHTSTPAVLQTPYHSIHDHKKTVSATEF